MKDNIASIEVWLVQKESYLKNLNYFLLTSFILLLGACASNDPRMTQGGVNEKTGVWENTVMSPYLELEKKYLEGKLIVRIVTTLGDERVTEGHYFTGNLTKDGKVRYKDGFTPEVTEVYFVNYSDSDIKVTPLTIEVFDSGTIKMKDNEIVVPAHNWKISSKHISATSVLINNRLVKFQFLLNGQEKEINGKVIRMSESAVKTKYSKN